MNRYVKLGLFLAFICPAAVYAAEDPLKFKKGEENFKMDTSFPVPYVAYDDINVRKELQLGLKDNAEISVGALDVQDKAVASVAASKTLSLQNIGNVTDTSFINLGNSSGTTATAKFADVTVNTISTKNSSVDVNIATVDNINAKTAMKLYPGKVKNPNLPTGCQKGWAWVPFALEGDDCNNQKYYFACLDGYKPSSCPTGKVVKKALWVGVASCTGACDGDPSKLNSFGMGAEYATSAFSCSTSSACMTLFTEQISGAGTPQHHMGMLIIGGNGASPQYSCQYVVSGEGATWVASEMPPTGQACTNFGTKFYGGSRTVTNSGNISNVTATCWLAECVEDD